MSGKDARAEVLAGIRASLNRTTPVPDPIAAGLRSRLERPETHVRPPVEGDLVDVFTQELREVGGIVTAIAGMEGVSAVVEAHVERFGLAHDLVVAPDPDLDDIAWSNRFRIERRAAVGSDRVGVTGAFAGIAETGTCVLLSGPESPTTLNFLPEDHLIVLRRERVLRHQEDVWEALRGRQVGLPRTVNLITGPSKTGDVEQVIQEGAHGPRRFHVVLVGQG